MSTKLIDSRFSSEISLLSALFSVLVRYLLDILICLNHRLDLKQTNSEGIFRTEILFRGLGCFLAAFATSYWGAVLLHAVNLPVIGLALSVTGLLSLGSQTKP